MTKFADQLFDDLLREHGAALAAIRPPAAQRRRAAARRTVLVAGVGGVAAAATVGTFVAVGGSRVAGGDTHVASAAKPAYAVTKNPDGTITLAVYQKSGIAAINAKLRQLGDQQVYVVPVEPGCPRPAAPAVPGQGHRITTEVGRSSNGSITVNAQGIPAGDILVVGVETTANGMFSGGELTSPPAPSCISLPAPPNGNGGSGSASG